MKLTLHDVLLPCCGEPGPGPRPTIPEAARGRCVRAMHALLARPRGDGRFGGEFETGDGRLRMDALRRGGAVAAVWTAGAGRAVVAASILLLTDRPAAAPDAASSDAGAALRDLWPQMPVDGEDLRGASAQGRPCLATFYCDARWFDNGRVELAATALALAVLYGAEGTLKVQGAADEAPPPAAPKRDPSPWFAEAEKPLPFNFTRQRLQLVMDMVTKKANAAAARLPGVHFRVHPPAAYTTRPDALRGAGIFDRLKHTEWQVHWFDGRRDALSFGEFLGFLDQVGEIEKAFRAATGGALDAPGEPLNAATWVAAPSGGSAQRGPVRVKGLLNARDLVADAHIRRLFRTVLLEREVGGGETPRATAGNGRY